ADHGPAGRRRAAQPPAGIGRTHTARPRRLDRDRDPARRAGGDAAGLVDRPSLPRHDDGRRVAAGVLHRARAGLCVLFPARLGTGAARPARRVLQRAADRHRLLSDRYADRARLRGVSFGVQPIDPAGGDARDLLAGADRAHDARLDAGGAGVGFRPHRARQRPVARQGDRDLRVPQRDAAGHHHAQHGVLFPARGQRAGRESVRLARHRLLCGGGADRIRLRARPGLRADHGGDVRRSQSADRHPLRRDRSARQAGRVGGAHEHRCADRRTRGSRPNLRACRSVRADPLCAEREQGHRLRLRAADPDPVRCVVRALCG
ncbi:hypothetical protein chiPu_0028901, partial [Chiloscyllium punctatum]|nr:hypothetical protein [Chiloscyllium punctatum]